MSRNADGLPDISRPTSKPSTMPSCSCTWRNFPSRTLNATVAPIFRAKSSRYSFTSLMTTDLAPACLTTATAMMPMGPAPVMSTSSPSTGNDSAVCTAFPKGSKIAATSRSMFFLWCQTLVIGTEIYSANAPGRLTPIPCVSLHRCRRPARQLRQRPQTTWPSALTISSGKKSVTFEPTSTTEPTNSWPTTIGTGMVCCAQASHL